MSVYIPGMEMPKNECVGVFVYPDGRVHVWRSMSSVRQEYKAVPVPPHGRLIDADALCEKLEKAMKIKPYLEGAFNAAISFALIAPTIIPASGGNKNE